MTKHKRLWLLLIIIIAISADQLSKYAAWLMLSTNEDVSILGGMVEFTLIFNSGGFLSIVSESSESLRFFLLQICVSVLLVGCLYYLFLFRKRNNLYSLSLVFITAGGLSNLIDRLVHDQGVIDYVSFGIGKFRTGIFNLADVYILVGSFALGYFIFANQKIE